MIGIKFTRYCCFLLFVFALSFIFVLNAGAKMKAGESVELSPPVCIPTPDGKLEYTITYPQATFIIIHFSEFNLDNGAKVELLDENGVPVVTYGESREAFHALAVDGDTVTVVLHAPQGSSNRVVIDRYGYGYPSGETGAEEGSLVESTCGADDKTDRECHKATYRYNVANSVARMLYEDPAGSGSWWYCTGSIVSPYGHFLTNNHCISTQSVANTLQARFNYEYTTCGGTTLKSYDTYSGSTLVLTNAGLDFSLLTISGNPATKYGYLPLSGRSLTKYEGIYIPQHPGGDPKKIAATYDGTMWCQVRTALASEAKAGYSVNSSLLHNCDTIGGSSGSPVLDTQNHVIGLHHTGYGCAGDLSSYHPTGNAADGYNGAILMSKILPLIAGYLPQDILDDNYGSCSGCSGNWVWGKVREAWRYTSGAQERIWLYFATTNPSYIWVDFKAEPVLSRMATEAAESYHWFGTYWKSSSTWSNARLWYY